MIKVRIEHDYGEVIYSVEEQNLLITGKQGQYIRVSAENLKTCMQI